MDTMKNEIIVCEYILIPRQYATESAKQHGLYEMLMQWVVCFIYTRNDRRHTACIQSNFLVEWIGDSACVFAFTPQPAWWTSDKSTQFLLSARWIFQNSIQFLGKKLVVRLMGNYKHRFEHTNHGRRKYETRNHSFFWFSIRISNSLFCIPFSGLVHSIYFVGACLGNLYLNSFFPT